ncbi:hypothetical protein FZD51_15665 [Bacillus infantis]|uniref:Uncharacterized protein n=1 Tax=Bacillus infantis TaxID=324767 RepID=A0A5D4R8E7_9BACI|nr:hypothetical protein FZD51_15665 [Bacillus infantis]
MLIAVEGTKTPVGDSGNVETPQRASARRLNSAPRKAKCLERKSTDEVRSDKNIYKGSVAFLGKWKKLYERSNNQKSRANHFIFRANH